MVWRRSARSSWRYWSYWRNRIRRRSRTRWTSRPFWKYRPKWPNRIVWTTWICGHYRRYRCIMLVNFIIVVVQKRLLPLTIVPINRIGGCTACSMLSILHNVTQNAFEKPCSKRITLTVAQGHRKWCDSIGHVPFHIVRIGIWQWRECNANGKDISGNVTGVQVKTDWSCAKQYSRQSRTSLARIQAVPQRGHCVWLSIT